MTQIELAKLRRAYGEIRQGFSIIRIGEETVYIKHLSSIERGSIDSEYIQFFEKAVAEGLSGEDARLKELQNSGEWTKDEEKAIDNARLFLTGLRETKGNLLIPSQLEGINKQIVESEEKLQSLLLKKKELFGFTAEEFANKKLNELYIFYSLYKNRFFDELYITREDMDYMEDWELGQLVGTYNNKIAELNDKTIKSISIARFFQDLYSLCEKDIYKFFGKPIADLTYYQCDLAQYGRFFFYVFSEHSTKPPLEIAEDPEKIIEWYNISKNAIKELDKRKIGTTGENAQSLMGATAKDYEQLGMKSESPSLSEIAAKNPNKKIEKAQLMALLNGQKV